MTDSFQLVRCQNRITQLRPEQTPLQSTIEWIKFSHDSADLRALHIKRMDLYMDKGVRLDANKIAISVDLDKVAELERKSLDRLFPRKARPDGDS